jgi:hypothetical protein
MKKQRGRPFKKGNKHGCGRPKGSRNKKSEPGKELLKEYEPHLTRKLISMGLEGKMQAMRMCMDRLSPAPRDASVHFPLPEIKSASDVATAAAKITRGMGKGKLSPETGEAMMNVLETHARVIETAVLEERVDLLETHRPTNEAPSE